MYLWVPNVSFRLCTVIDTDTITTHITCAVKTHGLFDISNSFSIPVLVPSLHTQDSWRLQMAQRKADWRVGAYVRVHGHLRSFENKKSMVVFSLKVILDFNEVSLRLTWNGELPSAFH